MKYIFYFFSLLLVLAGLYTVYGIATIQYNYYKVKNPAAKFQTFPRTEKTARHLKIVDFTNYRCGGCKKMFPTLMEMRELHPDVTYVPRLITLPENPQAPDLQQPARLVEIAIAAGLQGRFTEFHQTFMEYPDFLIPEAVIEETANLYGLDYGQLVADAKGEAVEKILAQNKKDANRLSIYSIPSYILNQNIYIMGKDAPSLKDILDMVAQNK